MTDRVRTLYVALEDEMRDDDIVAIVNAIKMVKGVAGVTPHPQSADEMVRMVRAGQTLRIKLIDLIEREFK
jgi:transcription antitermination factor NusG